MRKYITKAGSGTTLASVIFPATGKVLALVAYSLTSDKVGSVAAFMQSDGTVVSPNASCAAGQKVITVDDNTPSQGDWAADDIAVLQHEDGSVERHLVASVVEDVSITTTANLAAAASTGAKLYRVTAQGDIPVGNTTVADKASGDIGFMGVNGLPLLIDLDGTAACSIDFTTAITE